MKKQLLSAFLFSVTAFGSAAAQLGEREDCQEPIDVGGEVLEVVDDTATLTGDVRVVQCDAILSTLKLVGRQDAQGAYESLTAYGDVRFSNKEEAIKSEKAIYDLVARTITFTDDVVVTQGKQVMTGGNLIYWIDTGKIRFTGDQGNRIRGVFHTGTLNAQL